MTKVKKRPRVRGKKQMRVIHSSEFVINYDEAVSEARQIIATIESNEMKLGELADRLEPRYGEQTLKKFAQEIGIAVCTLERRRSVYRAWKDIPAPAPISFSVAQELAAHPERARLITEQPNLTKGQARKLTRAWRKKDQEEKASDVWELKEMKRWFKDLVERASDALRDGEMTNKHPNPAERLILRQVVEPTMLATIRQGGEALIKLADFLLEHCQDETPAEAA